MPRKLILLAAGAFLSLSGQSSAQYYDYPAWANNTSEARAIYVAGLADALSGLGETTAGFRICLGRLKMKNGQLADNLLGFALSNPEMHSKPVSLILMEYLIRACEMGKKQK